MRISDIKEKDVFSFRYNEETKKKLLQYTHDVYHCFDGQLVARKRGDGIILEDTYWGYGENRSFTIEEALEKGTLTFKCNFDEVEKISESDLCYYANEDIFNLSYQHDSYKSFAVRKGAKRSKEKMLAVARQKKEDAIYKVESGQRQIEEAEKLIEEIESGNINVYL